MKIVAISDTHNQLSKIKYPIPDGDILIFTGDISGNSLEELNVKHFNEFLLRLPHKHKVCIAGNHDFIFQKKDGHELLKGKGIHYLEDESVIIDGIKFYGTPYQPYFYNWAFNIKAEEDLAAKWSLIPDDTDILLTHNAPYGILDLAEYRNEHTGCRKLLERLKQLPNLKAHCFGHIHESYGLEKIEETIFVNSCICNLEYKPVNKPIVFEI